jgi:hypothetical protein
MLWTEYLRAGNLRDWPQQELPASPGRILSKVVLATLGSKPPPFYSETENIFLSSGGPKSGL